MGRERQIADRLRRSPRPDAQGSRRTQKLGGGATSYLANGKLIGGVGLLAYPAKYLTSGVKSLVCNTDGIVYEKDLGPGTATLASKIMAYDPDAGWTRSK